VAGRAPSREKSLDHYFLATLSEEEDIGGTSCSAFSGTSVNCCLLTHAMESCCRQRLRITCDSLQWSIVRAQRYSRHRLSCSKRTPLRSWVDNMLRRSTWCGAIFQVQSLNSEGTQISLTQCRIGRMKLPCQKPARFVRLFQ